MVCLYCGQKTQVVNSRMQKRLGTTWRRRACTVCGAVFTTIEAPDLASGLRVRHVDGSLTPFERDVLFMSIVQSLGHRADAVSAATALTDTVLTGIIGAAENAVVDRSAIITAVIRMLRQFDTAATTYYAAYHQ